MTEKFIRRNADAVLQICTYYLGKGTDSETAFVEVFCRVGRECPRRELYRQTRDVCLSRSANTPDPSCEEWLYGEFFGLDREQTEYILGDVYDRRDVSKLSILSNV